MRARRFSVGSHLLYRFGPGAAMDKNRALPEIGEEGGRIVAVGTPEEVRQVRESVTARFL